MDNLEKGDQIVLYPPLGRNPALSIYSGQEAVIVDEPAVESNWCMVLMRDGMRMRAPHAKHRGSIASS